MDFEQTMDFDCEDEGLQLQHLAGGNIVRYPPLFGSDGEFLLVISDSVVQIYSTVTGEITRQLTGATSKIISMEFELRDENVLVACTASGDILRWKWKTNNCVVSTVPMQLRDAKVLTFNLINFYGNSETACAFVTVRIPRVSIQWFVMDSSSGNLVHVRSNLRLTHKDPLVAVDAKHFKNIVIAQGFYIYFLNYETWIYKRLRNAREVPVTALRIHPVEEMVASGDEEGHIFLWRQFMENTVCTSLYHWHHTAVTDIVFSNSGASFFSSGHESVLVKWNVANPNQKEFIPRFSSIILHIAISGTGNSQVAICTADNGVKIFDGDNQIKCTLQQFTYIIDDKTGNYKFPVGLRLDPRSNCLVLNGRKGHLQFYSVHTKNLLYNMDIVVQNQLSTETGRLLYDIRVTKAAFNIDWMVTGEEFNDEEHLPELRLKFWKYQKKKQSYVMNTNVELPHEGGFKAIEFSSEYQVANLLCATVGEDNIIKIWSLEDTYNTNKKGKAWYCIGQTGYKCMIVESISFSQDGSLLAAGFGNTLCLYKADTLMLKAALSCSPGRDGCVGKAQACIFNQTTNGTKSERAEKHQKMLQLFSKLLETYDESLISELRKMLDTSDKKHSVLMPLGEINDIQKELLYNNILKMNELNLFHKILLFQKLKIFCEVHPQGKRTLAEYLRDTVAEEGLRQRYIRLHDQTNRVNLRHNFKAKYRLHHYETRKRFCKDQIIRNLIPIMSIMNLNATPKKFRTKGGKEEIFPASEYETLVKFGPPTRFSADISRVHFATGEHSHLVVVCTQYRVLIWNLLTLRLQSVLKLSVQHLTLDPQTNLIAAFSKTNELYIFQPNVPLPIYQHRNLPKIYGATWLARCYPKPRSINLDWQAHSTLYFITEKQEIMYLGSYDDDSCNAAPPITMKKDVIAEVRYSAFGTFAAKQMNGRKQKIQRNNGRAIVGMAEKSAVKVLFNMSTHTMSHLSLLCGEFAKALVKQMDCALNKFHQSKQKSIKNSCESNNSSNRNTKYLNRNRSARNVDIDSDVMNGNVEMHSSDGNVEDDDGPDGHENVNSTDNGDGDGPQEKIQKEKKFLLWKEQAISKNEVKTGSKQFNVSTHFLEAHLKSIAKQNIELEI